MIVGCAHCGWESKDKLAPDVREVSGKLACGHPKTWVWTAAELRLLAVEKERG